jgi:SAM-dependent methyltransferase
MGRDSLFYRITYRFGKPRWDVEQPRPELESLVESRAPGRALDLGCGTGANDVFLAGHGWHVVGVDFAPEAIEKAQSRAKQAGVPANFVVGDVSRLRAAGVQGLFDLVLDIGCYHALPADRRDAYAAEVAAVTRPGADFYLAGISDPPATWKLLGANGVSRNELEARFGASFEISDEKPDGRRFVTYHLVRRSEVDADHPTTSMGRASRPMGDQRP